MYAFKKIICATAISSVAMVAASQASINPSAIGQFNPPKSQLQLVDAEGDVAPIAFYKFCAKNVDQCHSDNGGQKIELNDATWAMLYFVNSEVDDRIKPNANKGAFDWSLATVFGNCNDYAVQKRDALLKAGLPMSALSLSAVKTESGEGHLVLTVRTTAGDYVLDNLRNKILPWNETGYEWLSVQSNADPFHWVHIKSAPLIVVATNEKAEGIARFKDI